MEELRSLVIRAQAGELDAYGQIVRRFQDMAYGYAYSILGDFHLAEDAAQEAFIRAYRDLGKLEEPAAFPGWFRRIVFKYCDRLRRRKRVPTMSLESAGALASERPTPAEKAERREMADRVLEAIRSLPENERAVTTLFYINGYSQKDIAEFLEVPVTTVNNRLHASRNRLKERMIAMVGDTFSDHALPDGFARQTVEKAVAEAQELNVQKKCQEAEKLMREVLQTAPDHPDVLRELNRALMWGRVYGEERWELLPELAEHGRTILQSGLKDDRLYSDLSDTLLAIPAMREAIEFIEEWIESAGPSLERLGKLAWARGCVGQYDAAESVWNELLDVGRQADKVEVSQHVPLATEALVDCLAAAGEKICAARILEGGWQLCRDTGAVRLQDTCFHSWPYVFKLAGQEAECAAVAKTWLHLIQLPEREGVSAAGEALCARAWFDHLGAVTADWEAWVQDRATAGDWDRLTHMSRAMMQAFLPPRDIKERLLLVEATVQLLRGHNEDEAASLREWWELQRYPACAYIIYGDLDMAESLAREAIQAGHDTEYFWLNDIAVVRGQPSATELMAAIAEKGPDGPGMWGGDAWYHVAREAAAAGEQDKAFDALRRACGYWRNPPLWHLKRWEQDARWGSLRSHPEFKRMLQEKRERIGPIHGLLMYFPGW